MKTSVSVAIASAIAVFANPAWASGTSSLSVSSGVDYSSGDYGTPIDTDILVVPFSLRYKTGNFRLTASVPWMRVDGSSAIIGGGSNPIVVDPNAPRTVRSGMGDVSIGAAYMIPEKTLGFGWTFSGRMKIPTASESKGLGTGQADFAVSTEISKKMGSITPFASVGYRMPGSSSRFRLHNAWTASAGASAVVGKSVLIVSYDYRKAISSLARDSHELFGAFSTPVSKRINVTLYGTGGLSKGAPNYGLGSVITYKVF